MVGPSGSGKSTLALALAGLIPYDIPGDCTGWLEIAGVDAGLGMTDLRGRLGLVFQDPDRQLVMERVEDDVAFGLENRGWPRDDMVDRVPEALAEVGLAGLQRRRPAQLSGGEQQRLALAGVLAPRPGVIVLDEPTANLDPPGAAAMLGRLAELRERRHTTLVLVEHRQDAAWDLADQVLALGADGRPIDYGPPGEVLARSRVALHAAGVWLPGDWVGSRREHGPNAVGAGRTGATAAAGEPRTEPATAAGRAGLPMAEAYDAWFAYEPGRPALRDIDLSISHGERIALTGPNGSGKSTLGRLIVGLLRPTRGTVRLDGRDPGRLRAANLARLAGYVFQDPERQFLAATVSNEIHLGLRRPERARVGELMDRLGLPLERFGGRSPYRLSGGEQRRLSLACVLVRRPRLLVLDEPTFGQDRHGYESLLEILHERLDDGAALVAATHDERLVADIARRRVVLEGGRVVADEEVAALAHVATSPGSSGQPRQAAGTTPRSAVDRPAAPDRPKAAERAPRPAPATGTDGLAS